jgi:hypothetical protein
MEFQHLNVDLDRTVVVDAVRKMEEIKLIFDAYFLYQLLSTVYNKNPLLQR